MTGRSSETAPRAVIQTGGWSADAGRSGALRLPVRADRPTGGPRHRSATDSRHDCPVITGDDLETERAAVADQDESTSSLNPRPTHRAESAGSRLGPRFIPAVGGSVSLTARDE
jgi:hypothetical protein